MKTWPSPPIPCSWTADLHNSLHDASPTRVERGGERARHEGMAKGLIWATAEDLAKNKGEVLSLYRQILRCLNAPELPLTPAARLARKSEVRTIFLFGAEERSLHNIADLMDAAKHSLSVLKKGRLP